MLISIDGSIYGGSITTQSLTFNMTTQSPTFSERKRLGRWNVILRQSTMTNDSQFKIGNNRFQPADYAVAGISILVSLGIGSYFAYKAQKKKQTTSEFIVASRQLRPVPVAISLVMTYESAIFIMGSPAEFYFYGLDDFILNMCWVPPFIIGTILFVPMLHRLDLKSTNEFIERRFQSLNLRRLTACVSIAVDLSYMGVVIYAPALALEAVSGVNMYITMFIMAVVALLYTSMGGMRAVIWTDVFQFSLMMLGIIAVIIKGTMAVGGFSEVFQRSRDAGRFNIDTSWDPRHRVTLWTILAKSWSSLSIVTWQKIMQRISSVPTPSDAQFMVLLSVVGYIVVNIVMLMVGMVTFAFYDSRNCDPLTAGIMDNQNQMIVVTVLELFADYPGVSGLFVASIFAASLSTLSSGFGAMGTNLWEDLIKPKLGNISEVRATIFAKMSVVVVGLFAIGMSVTVSLLSGTLSVIANMVTGIITTAGIVNLALLFPPANAKGAFVGCAFGSALSAWLFIGRRLSSKVGSYPYLPLPNITGCYVDGFNTTTDASRNVTLLNPTTEPTITEDLGIDVVYTISPFLYPPIISAVGAITGLIFSLIIGSKDVAPIKRCLVPPALHRIWEKTRFLESVESEFQSNEPEKMKLEMDDLPTTKL